MHFIKMTPLCQNWSIFQVTQTKISLNIDRLSNLSLRIVLTLLGKVVVGLKYGFHFYIRSFLRQLFWEHSTVDFLMEPQGVIVCCFSVHACWFYYALLSSPSQPPTPFLPITPCFHLLSLGSPLPLPFSFFRCLFKKVSNFYWGLDIKDKKWHTAHIYVVGVVRWGEIGVIVHCRPSLVCLENLRMRWQKKKKTTSWSEEVKRMHLSWPRNGNNWKKLFLSRQRQRIRFVVRFVGRRAGDFPGIFWGSSVSQSTSISAPTSDLSLWPQPLIASHRQTVTHTEMQLT